MKTWMILLTVGAVSSVVAIPLVTAEDGCSRATAADGAIDHPAKPGSYLYFGPDASKLGEWTETNGWAGLQTVNCLAATGSARYSKDTQVPLLG